jgi:periplasmic protein TonB
MAEGGFLQQKRRSPVGFGMVVAGHAAALAAVILIKGPVFDPADYSPIELINLRPPPEPDPVPPPPKQQDPRPQPQAPTVIDRIPPVVDLRPVGPVVDSRPYPPLPPLPPGNEIIPEPTPPQPVREPVRVAAIFDPRYADALQPPYPASEQRAEREGQVRVRVTIGTDGRVKAIQRLSATSEAFWASAERHARARWRFRPATADGRPVESTKDLTLYFRLENA